MLILLAFNLYCQSSPHTRYFPCISVQGTWTDRSTVLTPNLVPYCSEVCRGLDHLAYITSGISPIRGFNSSSIWRWLCLLMIYTKYLALFKRCPFRSLCLSDLFIYSSVLQYGSREINNTRPVHSKHATTCDTREHC